MDDYYDTEDYFANGGESGISGGGMLDGLLSILTTGGNVFAQVKAANALNNPTRSQNIDGQFVGQPGEISPLILLIGAGLLLFVFMKD